MTATAAPDLERRVLVVAPTVRDARTTQALLEASDIAVETCATADALIAGVEGGAAALLVAEETLSSPQFRTRLADVLRHQPSWSDLPILVFARTGSRSAASDEAVRMLGNVTLLDRPVRIATLLSAVRTALRARGRQLEIRGLLSARALSEASLRRADQRKDEFLATLGHELRNPLAPLVTGLHLLRASGRGDAQLLEVTAVMERQVQHLVRLVDDLLEVARITEGRLHIERAPTDLVVAVKAAIDISRPLFDGGQHGLTVELPMESLIVAGDLVRLTQVFTNLLTNAAKYSNPGGAVWLTLSRGEGQTARVSIRDSGIGIPATHLESIFDTFVQVDRTSRRAQGGLGIGLTLVRRLVEMHGGRVHALSAGPGTGSEFIVELPTLAESARPLPVSVGPRPFPKRRLLIVDDNRDAAETLAALLASLGVTVAVAYTGQEALDGLAEFAPEVVLLDIGLPDMDGYAVARRIRLLPQGADVLLIALTGWGLDQDVRQARAAGFDHHLVKPPDMEKLRLLVTGQAT
jgi:signal transduction histidine kinase